jgi:hypothetical protein
MKEIDVYGSNFTKEDLSLIKKIMKSITKEADINYTIFDIATLDLSQEIINPTVIFGYFTKSQITIKEDVVSWCLPDIKKLHNKEENKKDRESANKIVEKIKQDLDNENLNKEEEKEEIPQEECVKLGDYSFGKIADICITEKEAEYLNRIKTILNGSKIIIKKGDITIEVS